MGIVSSVDTRRISFDNELAETPALNIQNSMDDDVDDVLRIESIEKDSELNVKDELKSIQEGGDNEYWNQRLEALKKEHQLINKIVESEYEKTVEHAKKYYEPRPTLTIEKIKKVKPCLDCRLKIMQCYEENPHQPLVCSEVVQAFTECVASCRTPGN
ncbi:MICOS complex subunit MIC19-like [Leguminivora glycinivorella]|uniref:MICOS complex subunit MIC19-like n=1 Tax=Leguminivora glycinivorella TaxID=1035111 RepID=UPI00200FC5E8|nr:MICOS complex subunit MIC19-like [Leguminivora glycinivorella]